MSSSVSIAAHPCTMSCISYPWFITSILFGSKPKHEAPNFYNFVQSCSRIENSCFSFYTQFVIMNGGFFAVLLSLFKQLVPWYQKLFHEKLWRWSANDSRSHGICRELHYCCEILVCLVSKKCRSQRALACWDRGFESHRGHGCLSVVSVVCLQVEVSATNWSLVQRSPTDCCASLCVI